MLRSRSLLLFPALLACACSTPPAGNATRTVADGESFVLDAGQSVTLAAGGTLRYLRLATDSRCPPEVQCIWAGDAEVQFAWTPAGAATQTFSLHTGTEPRSHALGGATLELRSLARGANPPATLALATPGR